MRKVSWWWLGVVLFLFGGALCAQAPEDPNLWLEEVTGEKALAWVMQQNAESTAKLEAVPFFQETLDRVTKVLDSRDRIAMPQRVGDYLYNFWQDAEHPRGIYRRATLAEYRKDKPQWEEVLDLDRLAKEEKENWVYKGMTILWPDYDRGLLNLSRGGADATVVREFDLKAKSFVKDGFYLPEAKSSVAWRDRDTVYVGTDFGPGSLSPSGYPLIVKLWKRGTPLSAARALFTGQPKSVRVDGYRDFDRTGNLDFIREGLDGENHEIYVQKGEKWVKLAIPTFVDPAGRFHGKMLLQPRQPWTVGGRTYKPGTLLVCPLKDFLAGKFTPEVLLEPTERMSIAGVGQTKGLLLVSVLDNVVSKLYLYTLDAKGKWAREIAPSEENVTLGAFGGDEDYDDYFVTTTSFLAPATLYHVAGKGASWEKLKSAPAFFDAAPYQAKQFEAVSADGTKVPYFVVMRKDVQLNGQNPTLLYGYGGFNIPQRPNYSGAIGGWLGKGGVYVLACLRGGGEFGPEWHQAAMLKNKRKSYEDFIAVAEDLIKRGITSTRRLAIQGGSNGGLLVGATMALRPDLFQAVVCQVPLLDMKRYHKLLAGASWMSEYGDPDDPAMWDYIQTYSPYQNVKKDVKYPVVFFTTSTRDDRVHPGHARKMVARMKDQGHTVYYYENVEGGHGGAANNRQRAYMTALGYAFLYSQLFDR